MENQIEHYCGDCRYQTRLKGELPCVKCKQKYNDQWQPIEDTTPIDFGGCGEDGCEIQWEKE